MVLLFSFETNDMLSFFEHDGSIDNDMIPVAYSKYSLCENAA